MSNFKSHHPNAFFDGRIESAKEALEARKARLRAKALSPVFLTAGKPGGRREYDDYMRVRSDTAVVIRTRLEETFLDYERQALSRKEYEAATAYSMAAALVRGTCIRLEEPVVSQDEHSNMQLPDGTTSEG